MARSQKSRIVERYIDALRALEGAYALVALTNKKLIGARDPLGIRPLILGELNGAYILCSETCALDIIGAKYIREIENGEVVVISDEGVESLRPFPKQPARPCIFEYIYFSRPDSMLGGRSIYEVRKAMGRELARESAARGRRGGADPRLRRSRRTRLRAGDRHSLRARHHPQPLCRAAPSSSRRRPSARSA